MVLGRFFLIAVLSTACSVSDYDLIISNVNVIDLETGEITSCDLFIKDSLIHSISEPGASNSFTNGDFVDGEGQFIIPGLWDMHVHIQDSSYLGMFLDYGITGVRDMGGCVDRPTDGCESLCPAVLNEFKEAMSQGLMSGPRLFIAGTQLSGTGWPTSWPVDTEKKIQDAFERNLKDQVDFIKVYEQISWASYQEIARQANVHDLDFVGHVSEPHLLSDILDLGQKSIEHIREPILYSFTNDPEEMERFMLADDYSEEDRDFVRHWLEDAENVITAFKRNQAWFTPTMAVQYARQRYHDEPWINHPLREEMPGSVTKAMQVHLQAMATSSDHKGDSLWWMALTKLVKRFSVEGIGMLAGSDAACEGGLPGYSLHEELFLMVEEAGLTPLEALQTAIINPAKYFELSREGKIAVNNYANLVLLKDNPLENIRNTLSIRAVVQNGKLERLR